MNNGINADNFSMLHLFEDPLSMFEIPVYQRNYEWNQKQCFELFNDLESLALNRGRQHFLGTVVCIQEPTQNFGRVHQIIDGQQRITSCMLLLKAISDLTDDLKSTIEDKYLSSKNLDPNYTFKLKPVEYDRDQYIRVMNGAISEGDNNSKILANYDYFKKLISNSKFAPNDLLDALDRMEIVYIALGNGPDSENPQTVFENINSTGVALTSADLIRNFLLMGIPSKLQNNLYRNYWKKLEETLDGIEIKEFIRHYLIMKLHRTIPKKYVYDEYKSFIHDGDYTAEEAVKDLYHYSMEYDRLVNSRFDDDELNNLINNINLMKRSVVYPYIMKLIALNKDNELSHSNLLIIIKDIEAYLYRSLICDYPSNGLNKLIASLCANNQAQNEVERLETTLLKHDFPDDNEFKDGLVQKNLYKNRASSIGLITLTNIESALSKETINFNDVQIEHIMPQTLNDDWRHNMENADEVHDKYVHTLGNLTLTKYNQEMSNNDYDNKKAVYHDSNILITRKIAENYPEWNQNSIEDRADKLSDEAIKIWPRPNREITDPNDISGKHQLSEDIDVLGHRPREININGENHKTKMWKMFVLLEINYIINTKDKELKLFKQYDVSKDMFKEGKIAEPKKLDNGEEVETQFGAASALDMMKAIGKIYGITDQISYVIK